MQDKQGNIMFGLTFTFLTMKNGRKELSHVKETVLGMDWALVMKLGIDSRFSAASREKEKSLISRHQPWTMDNIPPIDRGGDRNDPGNPVGPSCG